MKRKISWIISIIAFVVPAVWAYFAMRSDREVQLSSGRTIMCGNVQFGIFTVALFMSALISFVALILNILTIRRGAKKGVIRYIEVLVIALPIFLTTAFVISFL